MVRILSFWWQLDRLWSIFVFCIVELLFDVLRHEYTHFQLFLAGSFPQLLHVTPGPQGRTFVDCCSSITLHIFHLQLPGWPLVLESPWKFLKNYPFFKALESPWNGFGAWKFWNLASEILESAWIPIWPMIPVMWKNGAVVGELTISNIVIVSITDRAVSCAENYGWIGLEKGCDGAWKSVKNSWFYFPHNSGPLHYTRCFNGHFSAKSGLVDIVVLHCAILSVQARTFHVLIDTSHQV